MEDQARTVIPRLRLERVRKRFPGTIALDDLELDVLAGEVHAVVGRNGAGKSTMIKIVAGIQRPDGGRVLVDGEPVVLRMPRDARRRGIVTVHQELSLVPHLSVMENVSLASLPRSSWRTFSWKRAERAAHDVLEQLGFGHISPRHLTGSLGMADRQAIEVAKALVQRAQILLLDEPTASLAEEEAERLARMVRNACAHSEIGVIYVSHRIDEVLAIADRVSVLRDGRVVDAWVGKEVTSGEVIASMLGTNMQERIEHVAAAEEVQQPNTLRRRATERGQPVLRVRNVRDNSRLRGVSFDVHGGEILGIVGLPGNGQDELVNSLAGLAKPVAGTITLQGRTLQTGSPRRMIRAGVGIVPGDRKSQGLVLGLSVLENLLLASSARRPFATSGIVRRRASRSAAEKLIADLQIKTAGQDVPAGVLSGGNQQKIVIGKWILRGCKLLILDQPTRGIDTGAKDEIYKLLRAIADNGTAILMITYEIEEATVADRVLVIRSGAIGKELASVELAHSLDGHQAVYGS